jgi:transcriptional regulator of heat shock response
MKFPKLIPLLLLLLCAHALAGEPGTLYAKLDKLRAVDRQIDEEVKSVAEQLKEKQISIQEAHAAWSDLLERAMQNGEAVRALQEDEDTQELSSMLDLVRKQQGRLQLLVDASKLEMEKGPQAAAETYSWQKSQSEMYFDVRKRNDKLFQQ